MKRIINSFILGIIGLIFVFDTFAYILHNDTISEAVTGWLNQSTTNLVVFLAVCAVFIVHFVFGKYRD
jgi:TRAP-type C4-dicarboxylate transport system permease large subunit